MKPVLAAALLAVLLSAPAQVWAEHLDAEDDGGRFLPTLSAAAGRDRGQMFGNGWLGVAAYPSSNALDPFFAGGAEVDVRKHEWDDQSSTVVTFGPQVRCGISFFPDANKYLSAINLYALAGYRLPSALNNGAARFGLGLSSPLVGVAALEAKLFIPWMAEVTTDVTPAGPEIAWRLGVAY